MKMVIENDTVMKDANIIGIMVLALHKINLDMIKISLIVLIEGGAEILIAINMNHHQTMFGVMISNPFINKIFREWVFV